MLAVTVGRVFRRIGSAFSAQTCPDFRASTMSSWAVEKNCRMGMSIEEKRRSYKVKSFLQPNDVPVWSEQIKGLQPPTDADVKLFQSQELKFDDNLNAQIASKVSIWNGDITQFEVDAIVNAANKSLLGGGGVDGAIHRAAGPLLVEECKSVNGCPVGEARITGGYLLPAKHVIHTVGPQNKSAEKLESCYFSCFTLMRTNELKSIVFPCVATGIYGFPHQQAAHIACNLTRRYLEEDVKNHGGSTERVVFCTFDKVDYEIYKSVAQLYFPVF